MMIKVEHKKIGRKLVLKKDSAELSLSDSKDSDLQIRIFPCVKIYVPDCR